MHVKVSVCIRKEQLHIRPCKIIILYLPPQPCKHNFWFIGKQKKKKTFNVVLRNVQNPGILQNISKQRDKWIKSHEI